MENHPIPQDITGFQFKLIGDMTVKQFGYLAVGVFLGWVMFISPLYSIIKLPIAALFVGLGAALAFLPIEGRPMDVMIGNFFKAVFSPTQYVYKKDGGEVFSGKPIDKKPGETSETQLKNFLNAIPQHKNSLDKKEMVFFQSLNELSKTPAQVAPANPAFVPAHVLANAVPQKKAQTQQPQAIKNPLVGGEYTENLQKTAELLEKELKDAQAKEAAEPQVDSSEYLAAHQKVLELQKSFSDLSMQKQQLEEKLVDLQKKMQTQGTSFYSPSVATPDAPRETKFARSIPQSMAKSVGLPIASEFPNVITGIIKDPRGNPLPNILVEVKDGQGNAVRAFKTNALGQFASATPLSNGDYTIEFEDSQNQNRFDAIAFKATGEILLPIEIISVDDREDLRRSLFN